MRKAPFLACGAGGHARNYTAVEKDNGDIDIMFGEIVIPRPSEFLRASAAIALQREIPGMNTADVVLLHDYH